MDVCEYERESVCPCVSVCQKLRNCVQSHTYACVSSRSSPRMPTHEADLDAIAVSGSGFRVQGSGFGALV